MRRATSRRFLLGTLFGLAWPLLGHAEPGGSMLHFTRETLFGLAGLLALPSACTCLLVEALVPRRRMPAWLWIAASVAAAATIVLALSAGKRGLDNAFFFLWFVVPPLCVLALRGGLPYPPLRLAAGTGIALAALALAAQLNPDKDNVAVLAGGATTCLLFWGITVAVLWAKRIWPESAMPLQRSSRSELRSAVSAARQRTYVTGDSWLDRFERFLQPADTGLTWWFASALVLYLGIGAAIARGSLGGGYWLYIEVQPIADLFGWSLAISDPKRLWWLLGLPWSLLAGSAIWGLAGLFGMFELGRARGLRLAAIVFGGLLVLWTAMVLVQTEQIRLREEQASGLRR